MNLGAEGATGTYIGLIGADTEATKADLVNAAEVGRLLAAAGAVLVCGGGGGVMEAGCHGASSVGGLTVGLLPGLRRDAGNRYLSVSIPTGMGDLRNGLIVRSSQALIAVGGGWGTLSEIALARKAGLVVAALGSWELPRHPLVMTQTPTQAVSVALDAAGRVAAR
ncbi:MAG: TIGR00725 family protein [Actinomycetales bacterium]